MWLSKKSDVVDALGGISAVATLTGCKYNAVQMWLARPRFPPEYYLLMTTALRERGHTAPEALWGMREVKVAKRTGARPRQAAE